MSAEPATIRPEYTEKLERQVKALADRLTLCLATFADYEIDFSLERLTDEERNVWLELQALVLSGDEGSEHRREKVRRSVFYEPAKGDVRRWLAKGLRK